MTGIDQLSNLMLCILEVYSLPRNYSEKRGGLSSHSYTPVIKLW